VIIDTAPADNKLLKNCLIAADEVIIPITADRYGIQGLADLNHTINTIRKRNNPNLTIAGLLLVKYHENLTLAKEVKGGLQEVAEKLGTKLFSVKIRESTNAQKAQAQRTTLIRYAPNSTTATDYRKLVDELIGE
jgi:chromosome partitioning protein